MVHISFGNMKNANVIPNPTSASRSQQQHNGNGGTVLRHNLDNINLVPLTNYFDVLMDQISIEDINEECPNYFSDDLHIAKIEKRSRNKKVCWSPDIVVRKPKTLPNEGFHSLKCEGSSQ